MSKVRLAIIGNGMVGHRFIEDLLDKADAAQFDITVFCEESRKAYDRVHLSSYFSHHTAEELSLVREGFYEKHGVKVLVGERAITINRQEKVIHSSAGRTVFYDKLIMATGSYPWIPPIKGSETQDCFVYRTIEDLNAIESCARRSKRGAVVGGGLLGEPLNAGGERVVRVVDENVTPSDRREHVGRACCFHLGQMRMRNGQEVRVREIVTVDVGKGEQPGKIQRGRKPEDLLVFDVELAGEQGEHFLGDVVLYL